MFILKIISIFILLPFVGFLKRSTSLTLIGDCFLFNSSSLIGVSSIVVCLRADSFGFPFDDTAVDDMTINSEREE